MSSLGSAVTTFDEMRSDRPVDHANNLQPPPSQRTNGSVLEGIVERREHGVIILSPATGRPFRRVIYTNSYGGEDIFGKIKAGLLPSHHLWGCFELARKGYEVAIVEPILRVLQLLCENHNSLLQVGHHIF